MPETRSGLLRLGLATTVVTAILASLGTWQVHRLAWKEDLIARVTSRTRAPPITAPGRDDPLARDADALDYRAVRVTGRYLPGHDAHVMALLGEPRGPLGGPGRWVMTPLERSDGSSGRGTDGGTAGTTGEPPAGEIVWVNRGFVPTDPGGRAVPATPPPAGIVTVEGIARRPEPRGLATPADDPAHDTWFVRDPATLSAGSGVAADRVVPYTIDAGAAATPPSGLPQAGETRVSFPNDHLGYAITWYGLALACLGVFTAKVAATRRRRGGGSPADVVPVDRRRPAPTP